MCKIDNEIHRKRAGVLALLWLCGWLGGMSFAKRLPRSMGRAFRFWTSDPADIRAPVLWTMMPTRRPGCVCGESGAVPQSGLGPETGKAGAITTTTAIWTAA